MMSNTTADSRQEKRRSVDPRIASVNDAGGCTRRLPKVSDTSLILQNLASERARLAESGASSYTAEERAEVAAALEHATDVETEIKEDMEEFESPLKRSLNETLGKTAARRRWRTSPVAWAQS